VKILNFISGRNLGGSKQAFLDYSMMCHYLGHQVYSMIRTGAPLKALLEKMPPAVADNVVELNYIRSKWPGFRHWAIKEFRSATADLQPDVVLVHKPIDLFFIRETFPTTKVVGVVHSFTAKHLHYADRVFAVSEALKNHIIDQGCEVPVSVINNAIEMPELPETAIPRKVLVIGTMAVFRRTKRLDLLIKSFNQLKQQGIRFKGIIAGAGIQRSYLKYLISKFNLEDQVELRPWVQQKESFFEDIDIFCITSKRETFSISLIEAMARKKAVVATACGGPNEIIEDQVNGLLTPVGDVLAFTEKLTKLIQNQPEREQMAQAGFDRVKNCYSSEVVRGKIQQQLDILTKASD
jgi:glycosyltransferase involved in cell wall biosynthesis